MLYDAETTGKEKLYSTVFIIIVEGEVMDASKLVVITARDILHTRKQWIYVAAISSSFNLLRGTLCSLL
jgi:hypothetical protein